MGGWVVWLKTRWLSECNRVCLRVREKMCFLEGGCSGAWVGVDIDLCSIFTLV